MSLNSNPYLLFCPYLPLTRPLRFDGWCAMPASQYTGPWLSPEFEALATAFLSSFQDANGVRDRRAEPWSFGRQLVRTAFCRPRTKGWLFSWHCTLPTIDGSGRSDKRQCRLVHSYDE